MICKSCRYAAKLWQNPGEDDGPSLLYKVAELHGPHKCLGGSWCDCQHTVLPKPISP